MAGKVIWLTGFSGAGKSTIAQELREQLTKRKVPSIVLDADVIRKRFWPELGYSKEDRDQNVRNFADLALDGARNGLIVLVAVIAPYEDIRRENREMIEETLGAGSYVEVFVDTPLEECKQRDPKGLYAKADEGRISNFTGVDDPYETPQNPEVTCRTKKKTSEGCAKQVLAFLL